MFLQKKTLSNNNNTGNEEAMNPSTLHQIHLDKHVFTHTHTLMHSVYIWRCHSYHMILLGEGDGWVWYFCVFSPVSRRYLLEL